MDRFIALSSPGITKKTDLWFRICVALMAISGMVLIWWITPRGPGISPDSIVYIDGAKSLLSGKGFADNGAAITNFPPLFPLFLAATSRVEHNFVQSARLLNSILFGLNLTLAALAVYVSTRRSRMAAILAACLFLLSAPMFELHAYAWSEPLFIALSIGCLMLLSLYSMRPTSALLFSSAACLGLAVMTRYIALAYLPAAFIVLNVYGVGRPLHRARNALAWFALACVPIGLWATRNVLTAGTAANRNFAIHPMPVSEFAARVILTWSDFMVPASLPIALRGSIIAGLTMTLIIIVVVIFKSHIIHMPRQLTAWTMSVICWLFAFCYILFLYISISFLDASTPVDMRLLLPVFVLLIVSGFAAARAVSEVFGSRTAWYCFVCIVALGIAVRVPDSMSSAAAIRKNGLWYTSRQWHDSETMAFMKSFAEDVRVYSNGPDILAFRTQRQSISIPEKISPLTMKVNTRYDQEIQAMCANILKNRAVLAYFDLVDWKWYLPTQDEVNASCNLPVLRHYMDGTVYGLAPR